MLLKKSQIGKILASLKKYDEAINKYDKAIELNPSNDYSFKLKGKFFYIDIHTRILFIW
jgi:tetratricopeptide (TPR) repeat protein